MDHISSIEVAVLIFIKVLCWDFLGVSGSMSLFSKIINLFRLLIHLVLNGLLGLLVGESCVFVGRFSLKLFMVQMLTRCLTKLPKVNATRTLLSQLLIPVNIFRWLPDVCNHDIWGVLAHFLLLSEDGARLVGFDRRVCLPLIWAWRSSLGYYWWSHMHLWQFGGLLMLSGVFQTRLLSVAVKG